MSDVLGHSGRAMIEALLEGGKSVDEIATLAKGRLRANRTELALALDGVLTDPAKFLIRQMLVHIDQIDEALGAIDERLGELLVSHRAELDLLCGLPGLDVLAAAGVLAEIGPDMSVFRSAHHLTSWGGVSPGSNESAANEKQARTRKGRHWLRVFRSTSYRIAADAPGEQRAPL